MQKFIITDSSKSLREMARKGLAGNWVPAAVAMLIYVACVAVPIVLIEGITTGFAVEPDTTSTGYMIGSFLTSVYSIVVTGAFTFGVTSYYLNMLRYRNAGYGTIFSGFSYLGKTIGLNFMMGLFVCLWSLLLFVPGIIASIRYSQAFYILVDDPSKGIMQCINESKEMMKGNKSKYFWLTLSFIGWGLLLYVAVVIGMVIGAMIPFIGVVLMIAVFLAFFAGLFVLFAYMYSATTIFYDILKGNLKTPGTMVQQNA